MGRIDHPSILHEDTYMPHRTGSFAISVRTPEDQVPRLSFGARDVLAHTRMVLRVCRTGYLLVQGMTHGVLSEA